MATIMDNLALEGEFPAIITANNKLDYESFLKTIRNNEEQLLQALLKHGALLFRGFPIDSPRRFANFIELLKLGNFVNYIGGDSPRDKVEEGIYTSTEAPSNLHIPLHQELSFIKYFPKHIYFFCEVAPTNAGETIIADARRIYQSLDKKCVEKFHDKGLTYISRYYHKSKIMEWVNRLQRSHKSWTEVFETHSKEEVKKTCLENEFVFRWLHNDWLEIRQTRPAIHVHPQTKESVWFNQAHLYDFNPRLLGLKRYIGAKLFYFRKTTRLHEIQFADGSMIPREDLYYILDTLQANTVAFPWKKGDVLVLDNILAMHGRATYTGKRRILTALTA